MTEKVILTESDIVEYAGERGLVGVAVMVTGEERDGYTWLPEDMAKRINRLRGEGETIMVGRPEKENGELSFPKVPYGFVKQASFT